jgi:hypothetical protein
LFNIDLEVINLLSVNIVESCRVSSMSSPSVASQPANSGFTHRTRNIGIAVVLVIALVIGILYAGGVFTSGHSPMNPFDFTLDISPTGGTVIQGQNIQTSVSLSLSKGSPEQVTLSASGGPSGATYDFSPSIGSPDFTSTLTITIPNSVPTDAYTVTVTASGGGKTYSNTYTISVLSARTTVSGTVTTTGLGANPTSIQFISKETGLTYTGSMSGNSYSISLPNQQAYSVICSWQGFLGNTGTFDGGTLTVNAGVGTTTMTQNFAG